MSFLGRYLVEQGAVTEAQLEDGLRLQREQNRRIGELAMERGVLSVEQVSAICDRQRVDPRLFGDIAVGVRQMTRPTLDALLFFQKVHHVYLGEALLLCGHITPRQHQELMGRYCALGETGPVCLRYLQDFFADNRIAELFFAALSRAVTRLDEEPLKARRLGEVFAWPPCRETAVVSGTVLGGRPLEAGLGLGDSLCARLAALPDGAAFYDTVLGYFVELLREASLELAGPGLTRPGRFDHPPRQCLFWRGTTPTGEIALAFWLGEGGA